MSITIGRRIFDRVDYDAEGDVLYLHVGDPTTAVDFDESPEGHGLRYDRAGLLVGITIVNARMLVDRDEPMTVTVSERITVDPAALAVAIQPVA